MKNIKLIKKSKLLLKNKIIKVSLGFLCLSIVLLLIFESKKSYSLPFEGNMMNTFPDIIKNEKDNIIEVYFIDETEENINTRYNSASIKADLTYNSTGSVKGWLEATIEDETKYILYIASTSKIYLYTGYSLFYEWKNLQKIDFSNVDTSNVTDMTRMFYGCTSLTNLDLSNFVFNSNVNTDSMLLGTNIIYITKVNTTFKDTVFKTGDLDGHVVVLGDLDGDGQIKLSDIMKAANYIYKNNNSLKGVYLKTIDYDNDGSYQLSDIMKMANELYKED